MRIDDVRLQQVIKSNEASLDVMNSIAGKYIYFEVPYEGELVCEQLENENGEVIYFKSEQEAREMIDKLRK